MNLRLRLNYHFKSLKSKQSSRRREAEGLVTFITVDLVKQKEYGDSKKIIILVGRDSIYREGEPRTEAFSKKGGKMEQEPILTKPEVEKGQGDKKQDKKFPPEAKKKKKIRYDIVRSHIKNGDVLLFKGRYFVSSIIKTLSFSSYSHAGVVAWWNKRLMVMEADTKGVVVSRLSSKLDKYKGEVEWYTCNQEISKEDRSKMVDFAQEELGKEFATWKAFWFGWKVFFKKDLSAKDEFRRTNKLFCSQYVAQIYNFVGIDLKKNREDRFMSPDDIANSRLLEKKGVFIIRKKIFLQLEDGIQLEIE
jgi:hypothetical protein